MWKTALLIFSFLVFFNTHNFAQKFDLQSHIINSDSALLRSTVEIVCSGNIGTADSTKGTAYFFYSVGNHNLYLITCKHIVDKKSYAKINIHFMDSARDTFFHSQFSFNLIEKNITYLKDSIDLVLLNLSNIKYFPRDDLRFSVFTEQNIPSPETIATFKIEETMVSLSYPVETTIFSKQKLTPFIFNCIFSTLPYINEDLSLKNSKNIDNSSFGINGSLVDGCSGSPVIVIRRSSTKKRPDTYYLMGTEYSGFLKKGISTLIANTIPIPIEYIKWNSIFYVIRSAKIREFLNK